MELIRIHATIFIMEDNTFPVPDKLTVLISYPETISNMSVLGGIAIDDLDYRIREGVDALDAIIIIYDEFLPEITRVHYNNDLGWRIDFNRDYQLVCPKNKWSEMEITNYEIQYLPSPVPLILYKETLKDIHSKDFSSLITNVFNECQLANIF